MATKLNLRDVGRRSTLAFLLSFAGTLLLRIPLPPARPPPLRLSPHRASDLSSRNRYEHSNECHIVEVATYRLYRESTSKIHTRRKGTVLRSLVEGVAT